MPQKIRLDSEHRYWLGNEQIPGFTHIVKTLGINGKGADFYTEAGRQNGTALHQWLLFLASGQRPTEEPDERIVRKVALIQQFLDDSKFVFWGGEEPMYEPHLRYACTPDIWGMLNGEAVVIDAKAGSKEKVHAAQTAAQKIALGSNGIDIKKRYALYLGGKTYKLVAHEDPLDLIRWKALVAGYYARLAYAQETP